MLPDIALFLLQGQLNDYRVHPYRTAAFDRVSGAGHASIERILRASWGVPAARRPDALVPKPSMTAVDLVTFFPPHDVPVHNG